MLVQKFSSHTSKFLSNFSIFVEMAFIQREKDDSCTLPKQMDFTNISQNYESGTEIGNLLEFDFVVPPPHS